jgi:hypothetical protein
MKKIIISLSILFAMIFLASCAIKGALTKAGILLTEGTGLNYEVTAGGQKYPFDIKIKEYSGKEISFDWNMGEAKNGTIEMGEKTLASSKNLFNYFSGGYRKLESETSVWISTELFKELKSGAPVEIGLGNGVKETFKYQGSETYSFGNKEEGVPYNIPVFTVATEDGKKEIWIVDDPQNRLIVMMNLDFRIDLVGYKPFK